MTIHRLSYAGLAIVHLAVALLLFREGAMQHATCAGVATMLYLVLWGAA